MTISADTVDVQDARAPTPAKRLVLFDGECGFCDRTIQWIVGQDAEGRFHFAPLQGSTADALRRGHPGAIPTDIDTVVFYDATGPEPRIHLRSDAVLRILEALGKVPRLVAILDRIPSGLADTAYRAFAAIRYRLFGKLDACRIPSPELSARIHP